MINIAGDYGPISEWADINMAFVRELGSSRAQDKIIAAIRIAATSEFGMFADDQARARPQQLNHVYEWGQLGQWEGRLWSYVVTGPKASKTMNYVFLPSVKPVPVGDAAPKPIAGDTRKAIHIFHWKAAVQEQGRMITIRPKNQGGVLAFPLNTGWGATSGGMGFSKTPISVMIGQQTQGQFEDLWAMFWGSGAGTRIVVSNVVEPTERMLPMEMENIYHKVSKSIPRPILTKTFNIGAAAHRNHTPAVKMAVGKLIATYLRNAREKEALGSATHISD